MPPLPIGMAGHQKEYGKSCFKSLNVLQEPIAISDLEFFLTLASRAENSLIFYVVAGEIKEST